MSMPSREVHLVTRPAGMPSPHFGWRDHTLTKADETHRLETAGMSGSEYFALLGMPTGANVGKMPVRRNRDAA